MRYCKNCILPDSRPGLVIESDGICNACKNSILKNDEINWRNREQSFNKLVKKSQGKMAKAEEEWNRIEYDLRGEREEHLRTCLQLKECRIQLNELDKESTQRISELTADITELKEQLQTAVDGATHQAELANAFCNIVIIINPGAIKLAKLTPLIDSTERPKAK